MKKILFIAFLFSGFLFSSCGDDLKDLLDVSINTTVTKDIDLTVIAGTNNLDKTVTASLDNQDLNPYLNKIKTLEIKKLSYKIVEFTGDESGTITANLNADNQTLLTITNKNVKTEFDNATVFEVTNKNALITAASAFLTNKTINLKTSGSTDCTTPMTFKIRVTIELGVVANPL